MIDFYSEIGIINNLSKNGKFEGHWWLPNFPNDKILGVAFFDKKDYVILKLYGTFSNNENVNEGIIPIILGESSLNSKITLMNCKVQKPDSFERQFINFKYLSLTSIEFIEGYHLENINTDLVNRVTLSFTNLTPWLNTNFELNSSDYYSVKIENDNLEKKGNYLYSIKSKLNNDLEIEFHSHLKSKTKMSSTMSFEIESYISIYHNKGEKYEYFKKIIEKLQIFISFATKTTDYAKNIKVFPCNSPWNNDKFQLNDEFGYDYLIPQRGDYKVNKEILNYNLFFDISLIKDDLAKILDNWINKYDFYEPSFEYYFSVHFNNNLFRENQFLFYIQAIEGILRKLQGDREYMNKKDFKDIILNSSTKASIQNFCPKLKQKISSEISRINEFGLRDRIDLFLEEFSDDFKNRILFNNNNAKDFTKNIADIRNYLSHLLDKKPECYSNSNSFKVYITKTRKLLEILILKIIGVEVKKIENNVRWKF